MHRAPAALLGDVQAIQQLADARQAQRGKPGHGLPQPLKPEADYVRGRSTPGSGAPFLSGQRRPAPDLAGPAQGEKAGLRPRPACTCNPCTPPPS